MQGSPSSFRWTTPPGRRPTACVPSVTPSDRITCCPLTPRSGSARDCGVPGVSPDAQSRPAEAVRASERWTSIHGVRGHAGQGRACASDRSFADQARALLEPARTDRLGNLLTVSVLLASDRARPPGSRGAAWRSRRTYRRAPSWRASAETRTACGGSREPGGPPVVARCRFPSPWPKRSATRHVDQEDRRRAARSWQGNADGLVFTTEIGTPLDPSNVRRSLAHIARAAQLEHVHPHVLRHAAASPLPAAGVSLSDISDTLGHRSVTVG